MDIFEACTRNNVERVKWFILNGEDLEQRDDYDGDTPLHHAVCAGNLEIMKMLLTAGADPNARDNSSATPLHVACQELQVEAARILIQSGADPHLTDDADDTPAHWVKSHLYYHGPDDENTQKLIRFFQEHSPDTLLDTILTLTQNWKKEREEFLSWFQENHPELYFSKFCTQSISPGQM